MVARALFDKGVARGELGEPEAAIAAFDEVIERFGASEALEIQVLMVSGVVTTRELHEDSSASFEAAIAAFDEVIERFGASEAPEIQVVVARALVHKGVTRGQLGEPEAAIAAFDEVIERFGASQALEIQVLMAVALFHKGVRARTSSATPRRRLQPSTRRSSALVPAKRQGSSF